MSAAAWAREPLLGTAIRSRSGVLVMGSSQVGVDVVEGQSGREHQHLGVVEQLADLLGGAGGRLVLRGHPRLSGLLDQLLADGVHAGVELRDGARAVGAALGLVGQLGPQLLERLHPGSLVLPCLRPGTPSRVTRMGESSSEVTPFQRLSWPVRTDRLLIRPIEPPDLPAIFAIRSQAEVAMWLSGTLTDYDAFVEEWTTSDRFDTTLVVELGGKVVGDVFLRATDAWSQRETRDQARGTQGDIGWLVDPAYAGQGIATEAARALLALCF